MNKFGFIILFSCLTIVFATLHHHHHHRHQHQDDTFLQKVNQKLNRQRRAVALLARLGTAIAALARFLRANPVARVAVEAGITVASLSMDIYLIVGAIKRMIFSHFFN